VVRPTLSDTVLKMPRGAQVIYPKDLGAILIEADIAPGMRVLEAGVGSGALSMALLRAGADVVGYELREDFAERAASNVEAMGVGYSRYRVEIRDVYEGIGEVGLDRILLDLPEPWRVLPHATKALRPGGILCAYLPSINQTSQLRSSMEQHGFGMASSLEVLHRTWHIEDRSVRPDHRMVGHTGFLTTARLLLPFDDPRVLDDPRGQSDSSQSDGPQSDNSQSDNSQSDNSQSDGPQDQSDGPQDGSAEP
jgi:tRNA (adenine57-N1/adenine58-N1)-methyltransferase